MQKFIKKLIERLEDRQNDIAGNLSLNVYYSDGYDKGIEYAIEIVNQLAEEYKDCILINTQGLDVGIQCAMCTNPMKSDRGCDGGCSVNKEMYKKVLDVIERHTQIAPYKEGE